MTVREFIKFLEENVPDGDKDKEINFIEDEETNFDAVFLYFKKEPTVDIGAACVDIVK